MAQYREAHGTDQQHLFDEPRRRFQGLIEQLQSPDAATMEHGELERLLKVEGFELIRQLLQSHLDLRAVREERRRCVVGSDGQARTHVRQRQRSLETIFGRVRVQRFVYSTRESTGVAPADEILNLPPELYSQGLKKSVVREASKASFDETVQSVGLTTGGHVPKRQAEQLVVKAARDFDEFYTQWAFHCPEQSADLLVLSVDGKGIVMRRQDLREETRQRADNSTLKLTKRVTRGETRNRKRDATVAAVYSVARKQRSAEQVMKGLGAAPKETTQPPRAYNKRVWASVAKEPEKVIEEVVDQARRRDPEQDRPWVVLVDGNRQQLRRIRTALKRHGLEATLVLDFIHVLEYLWRAAYCLYDEGTLAAERWVIARARAILEGRASHVAAGIRRSATLRGLEGKKRKIVDRSANYLLKYKDMLRYDIYLAAGLPIATGVIEGACRHLVKDRMDVTGARWSLDGAEALLRMRSLKASNDLDAYWDLHAQNERVRHYGLALEAA